MAQLHAMPSCDSSNSRLQSTAGPLLSSVDIDAFTISSNIAATHAVASFCINLCSLRITKACGAMIANWPEKLQVCDVETRAGFFEDAMSAARKNILKDPKLLPDGGAKEFTVSATLQQKNFSIKDIDSGEMCCSFTVDNEIKTDMKKKEIGIPLKSKHDIVPKSAAQIVREHHGNDAPAARMSLARRVFPLVSLNLIKAIGP